MKTACMALIACALTACGSTASKGDRFDPTARVAAMMPESLKQPAAGGDPTIPQSDWWRQLNHPQLEPWVDAALANNTDFRATLARIAQANAQAGIVGAARMPVVNAGLTYGQTTGGTQAMNTLGTRSGSTRDQLNLQMSYEFDFWGRREFSIESALQQIRSAEYGRSSFEVSLIADVAAAYFRVVALRERLALNDKMIEMARKNTSDIRRKLGMGEATQVMLSQQLIFEQNLRAQGRDLQLQQQQVMGQLAYLSGQHSGAGSALPAHLGDVRLPLPAAFQPAELLCRRPDLRQAEADLRSANADVGVARTLLLPNVSVSLLAGQVATGLGGLMAGANGFLQAGMSASQNIFDGGARRQGVALSEARRAELMERYASAILAALRDTQGALDGVQLSVQKLTWLQDNRAQAQQLASQMQVMLERGGLDFAQLIQIQTAVYTSEDAAVSGLLDRVLAQIELYKAIGGSLDQKPGQCKDMERRS
jgi:NodT family efflux transporter outer membrane factor (OMF) lipoprotein